MTPLTTRAMRSLCVLAVAGVLGFGATAADASPGRYHRSHVEVHGGYGAGAGTLFIGGRSFHIAGHTDVSIQIVDAFRRCGHRARIDRGCVRVEWCGRRPSISWSSLGWDVGIRYGRGCGILTPKKRHAHRVRYRPSYRGGWGRGHRPWRPHRWHDRWRSPRCW